MKLSGNILEAIRDMIEVLTPVDRNAVIKEEFKNLIRYHHSYGMHIRNNYGLWEDTKLRSDLYSLCEELDIEQHPDSCSHILIEQMWCRLVLDNVDIANDENIRDANKELIS
jgi:hypothetical protein